MVPKSSKPTAVTLENAIASGVEPELPAFGSWGHIFPLRCVNFSNKNGHILVTYERRAIDWGWSDELHRCCKSQTSNGSLSKWDSEVYRHIREFRGSMTRHRSAACLDGLANCKVILGSAAFIAERSGPGQWKVESSNESDAMHYERRKCKCSEWL